MITASMYLQGKKQSEIAAHLKCSQQNISLNLKVIRDRWKESTSLGFDEHIAREIAKVDEVESECWEAWTRSKEGRTTKSGRQRGTKEKGKVVDGDFEVSSRTEQSAGDVRFLDKVLDCIDKRAKLLGLYAPEKHDHTLSDKRNLTDSALTDRIHELLGKAGVAPAAEREA